MATAAAWADGTAPLAGALMVEGGVAIGGAVRDRARAGDEADALPGGGVLSVNAAGDRANQRGGGGICVAVNDAREAVARAFIIGIGAASNHHDVKVPSAVIGKRHPLRRTV